MNSCFCFILIFSAPLACFEIEDILEALRPTQNRERMKDWEDCGELGATQQNYSRSDSSCMWDCQWKENPYHKYWFPWTLYLNDEVEQCNIIENAVYYITAPRIPTNLTCLEDCFNPDLLE